MFLCVYVFEIGSSVEDLIWCITFDATAATNIQLYCLMIVTNFLYVYNVNGVAV